MSHAKITINPAFRVGAVDRRLFGGFVEHLGRGIYTGIYEPGHPTADKNGFRNDVADLVKELGVTVIRYPGGNFVSGYNWEDGIGPKEHRPRRLDLAWHSTETNEVGLDEFATWVRKVNGDLMLAVNLGTRGVSEALDLLEYANISAGTKWAEQRRANGQMDPHNVRTWCLGNEMDGPWQLGRRTAEDYAEIAGKTAQALRQIDPALELVICGSSKRQMPTFATWERTVLLETFESVDFISCHAYFEELDGDLGSFLASGVSVDKYIQEVVATIEHVKAALKSDHVVDISFDEWNVWYNPRFKPNPEAKDPQDWPIAPRLLEDVYSVADAVVVGGMLISLLKHADRVKIANLAQLVNVIAPIMTEPGGDAWRQTTFYPFAQASACARGEVLQTLVEADQYTTAEHGQVDIIDSVATFDQAKGSICILMVNRSMADATDVTVALDSFEDWKLESFMTLSNEDFYAKNTVSDQNLVRPVENTTLSVDGGHVRFSLPPVSWSCLVLETAPSPQQH